MKKIGNIVTNNKIKYDDAFNKVNDISLIDASLPTLIIGLELAKKYIKDFNILKKEYNGDLFWTFKKTERRFDYETDLSRFYNNCIEYMVKDVRYTYINFINYSLSKVKSLISYINSNEIKYSYLLPGKEFLFIYDSKTKNVMGISLSLCEYIGINKNKVINKIINNINIIKVDNKFAFSDLIKPYINNNPHYILPLFEYFIK